MKVIYHGLFVNNIDSLKAMFPTKHVNKFSHHVTLKYKPESYDNSRTGIKSKVHIVGRLITDKVDVLLIKSPKLKKHVLHLTLGTAKGIAPFESNLEILSHEINLNSLNVSIDVTEGYFDGTYVHV